MIAPSTSLDHLESFFQSQQKSIRDDFFKFLRFKSISTDPDYKSDVLSCCSWVEEQLKKIGLETERWETSGHPTIFASHCKAGPGKPTVLIYNHYDVQPVDPLELWDSPPFEPVEKDGEVFARGAQDNKGQCFYVLKAIEALFDQEDDLPVNLKLVIEGEEETGSAGISAILKERAKQLKADYLIVADAGMQRLDQPSLTLGCRGTITMHVELEGANSDLHSGSHGGLHRNTNHVLIDLLSRLRDAKGHILVPGFYDDVKELSDDERSKIDFTFDSSEYREMFGAEANGGEEEFSPFESAWIRPTLEINGISGGYSGPGFKTVIPAKASAKISCRLVPGQDPEKTGILVLDYLKKQVPKGFSIEAKLDHGGPAVRSSPNSKGVKAFAQAYSEVMNKPCRFTMEGGSIPVIASLADVSGSEVVLMGFGLPDDKIHAPNEHFSIDRIRLGMLSIARALQILGE